MSEFAHVQHGCLPSGTETSLGTIEEVSLSSYRIAGRWYHFTKLHGPYKTAEPLWEPMRYKLTEEQQ